MNEEAPEKPKSLSVDYIESLVPVKGKQTYHFDNKPSGLVLRVNYGSKTWFMYYRDETKKVRWFKLGGYDKKGPKAWPPAGSTDQFPRDLSLDGARDAARKFVANKTPYLKARAKESARNSRSKGLVAPADSVSGSIRLGPYSTFEEVARKFIERRRKAKNRRLTLDEIERCINRYLMPAWKDFVFADIKRSDVNELRDTIIDGVISRQKDRNATRTVTYTGERQASAVLSIARKMMHWYEHNGASDDYICPIRDTKHDDDDAKADNERERNLDDTEIKLVWNAASKLGPYGSMVKLLLLTAQRREKVVSMKWSDINADGVWDIPRLSKQEKGTGRLLKLSPFTHSILNAIVPIKGCSFVFAGRYGDKPFNSFPASMRELRKLLPPDMEHWYLHDLRRTARTIMGKLRIPDRDAEQVLGHTIAGVEKRYNKHDYFDEKAVALQQLSDYVESLVDPKGDWKRKAKAAAPAASADPGRKAAAGKSRQAAKRTKAAASRRPAKVPATEPA